MNQHPALLLLPSSSRQPSRERGGAARCEDRHQAYWHSLNRHAESANSQAQKWCGVEVKGAQAFSGNPELRVKAHWLFRPGGPAPVELLHHLAEPPCRRPTPARSDRQGERERDVSAALAVAEKVPRLKERFKWR
jgi:hypothetical protein